MVYNQCRHQQCSCVQKVSQVLANMKRAVQEHYPGALAEVWLAPFLLLQGEPGHKVIIAVEPVRENRHDRDQVSWSVRSLSGW